MKNTYQISEYSSFVRGKHIPGYTFLPCSVFDALENFILTNSSGSTDALDLMSISARKGVGKIITAKNYVGVVSMGDGVTIEILPKIYSENNNAGETQQTKRLLIDMLKTLKSTPYKSLQYTNVNTEKMNIFEVFIRMFIDEVFSIVKHGLRLSYETIQSNEAVFKGKMKFDKQLTLNFAHKERCYIEYDEFNVNRPENKILKTTIQYLYRTSSSVKNKSDLRTLLNYFCDVSVSKDYKSDFNKIVSDRNTKDYETALLWSKVFLSGRSFTSFAGSQIAFALLFPMETLFESYIATKIKKALDSKKYSFSAQDRKYHLFDSPSRKFLLKPDIVIKHKTDNCIFVMDTKWKILNNIKSNYGISQQDMYQMYAYQKKYNSESVTLLYPKTDSISDTDKICFTSDDGACVNVKFIDLFNVDESIKEILNDVILKK